MLPRKTSTHGPTYIATRADSVANGAVAEVEGQRFLGQGNAFDPQETRAVWIVEPRNGFVSPAGGTIHIRKR